MNNLRTPPGPLLVAHEYMQLLFRLRVPVKLGTVLVLIECTRCGGDHELSQCHRTPFHSNKQEMS